MNTIITTRYNELVSAQRSKSAHLINESEAKELIGLANQVNKDNAHCSGAVHSHKGTKELSGIFNSHKDKFDACGSKTMDTYLRRYSSHCC